MLSVVIGRYGEMIVYCSEIPGVHCIPICLCKLTHAQCASHTHTYQHARTHTPTHPHPHTHPPTHTNTHTHSRTNTRRVIRGMTKAADVMKRMATCTRPEV